MSSEHAITAMSHDIFQDGRPSDRTTRPRTTGGRRTSDILATAGDECAFTSSHHCAELIRAVIKQELSFDLHPPRR